MELYTGHVRPWMPPMIINMLYYPIISESLMLLIVINTETLIIFLQVLGTSGNGIRIHILDMLCSIQGIQDRNYYEITLSCF